MKEVKKCSLCGVAFTMESDAYEALSEYLESLRCNYRNSDDGEEIVADIEARIAELILSAQDRERVVGKPLVLNIIMQMGSADDISSTDPEKKHPGGPRIPRRLYRDTENARLGGVCAGIGKYFDVDPVWVRLTLFLPLLLAMLRWVPFLYWTGPTLGNLFVLFVISYLIMWFAVPAARTARQKLEMNGEKITVRTIDQVTAATTAADPDALAKPIVAEVVSRLGQVVLILLKLLAGLLVFGLILSTCALIIGMFAVAIGGPEIVFPGNLGQLSTGVLVSGLLAALIPVILFIYVLMCLIASRKPRNKTVLAIFLLWLASIITVSCLAIREKPKDPLQHKYARFDRFLESRIIIDGDTTSLRQILKESDDENIIEETPETIHITVPSQGIKITVDKSQMELKTDHSK